MSLKKIVYTALFAALICVVTAFVKVPLPVAGYIHLGDVFVFAAAAMLPLPYALVACAIGGAFADLLAGFPSYALVTALAKMIMALTSHILFVRDKRWLKVVGVVAASAAMAIVYGVFEAFVYDVPIAVANLPLNLLQGVVGGAIALPCCAALRRINI